MRKFSLANVSTNDKNLNGSYQRHNHSFFEVKSLTNDFSSDKKNNLNITIKNKNSRISYLYPDKIRESNTAKTINTIKNNNNSNSSNRGNSNSKNNKSKEKKDGENNKNKNTKKGK